MFVQQVLVSGKRTRSQDMKIKLTSALFLASLSTTFSFPTFEPFTDATATGGTSYPEGSNIGGQRNALGDRWYNVFTSANTNSVYLTNSSLTYSGLPALGGKSLVTRNLAAGQGAAQGFGVGQHLPDDRAGCGESVRTG